MNQKQSKIDFFQGGRAQEYLMLVFQDRQRRKRSIFFAFDGLDANAAAFTFLKFDSLPVDPIKNTPELCRLGESSSHWLD